MRCRVGRLRLFFLLFCLSFSLSFAASFTECFQPDTLSRFWLQPQFYENNPYIGNFLFLRVYSLQFDNSSFSLGLEGISIIDGEYLHNRLPSGKTSKFAKAKAALDSASSSLEAAKASEREAHSLYLPAKRIADEQFGIGLLLLSFVPPGINLYPIYAAANAQAIEGYLEYYPAAYSSTLENGASAADSANKAGFEISQMAQEEYEQLEKAGAGSAGYSGKAKETFYYAQSLLSERSGFCIASEEKGAALHSYFSSSPKMPDFSTAGFSDYLTTIAGRSENSSIMRMASLYLMLSDADEEMEAEYSTALLSAQTGYKDFSLAIASLDGEELSFIGNPYRLSDASGEIVVGSSYAGIESGLERAKEGLQSAKLELDEAQSSHAAKSADGYVASAILHASSSYEISQNGISSLSKIRADAETAVYRQKQSAENAISKAKQAQASSTSTISFSDASANAQANELLLSAEAEFLSAEGETKLGKKFAAFASAEQHASGASALFGKKASAELVEQAKQELSSLSWLLQHARADGLDVTYEQGRLLEYQKLLSFTQSPEAVFAIISSSQTDRQSILLRLSEMYSSLPGQYAQLSSCTGTAGKSDTSLTSQFSTISRYFRNGQIALPEAAGTLSALQGQIITLQQQCNAKIPSYLSTLLSKNAHSVFIFTPATLGKPSGMSLLITTENPSEFGYDAKISFETPSKASFSRADFASGDALSDAYPQKGMLNIELYSVSPGQHLTFKFEKTEQLAQIASSNEECALAFNNGARVMRSISFFAPYSMDSLAISEPAPSSASDAHATFSGTNYPLDIFGAQDGMVMSGSIPLVPAGKNSLEISYSLNQPFTLQFGERSYETVAAGQKKVSFTLAIAAQADCAAAQISLYEPFSSITNLSAQPLGGEKVSQQAALPSEGSSAIFFTISPLRKGTEQKVLVSYLIQNYTEALSDALASAELQVKQYNRTSDILALSTAKELISQGKPNEALAILSKMRQDAQSLSASADAQLFLQEKTKAEEALSEAASFRQELLAANLTEEAAELSSLSYKLQTSLDSSTGEADSGGYSKALSTLRKARGDFLLSLSSLSWQSITDAEEEYAKARKAGVSVELLSFAESLIADAQKAHASQDYQQSLLLSGSARKEISLATAASSLQGDGAKAGLEQLSVQFYLLKNETDALLSTYYSQYSVLSSSSKQQLPITPSVAQQKISDSEKQFSASLKLKDAASALSQANASYQKLLSVRNTLDDSLALLAQSAGSSLQVAKIALSEVKSKSGAEDSGEVSQIESEVGKAESFLTNALYADSLVSSDRAIKAANLFLSKKGGGMDLRAAFIGALSLLFLAAAAYYFLSREKKRKPDEKHEMPKAEEKKDIPKAGEVKGAEKT